MRTQALLDKLVDELVHNCGDILGAAKACGVSLFFVTQWRKDDKVTNDALTEAERMGTQGLVSAAIERAVNGVQEDIYYKGHVCGQKTVYSDSLLTTLLKGKVDDFKAGAEGGTNVTVNVANVMPRAANYEEWLAMREATAISTAPPKLTDASAFVKGVMAPPADDVIDATFKVATPAFAGISL